MYDCQYRICSIISVNSITRLLVLDIREALSTQMFENRSRVIQFTPSERYETGKSMCRSLQVSAVRE